MANPVKGEAPLVLTDGRRFKLVLDMEALVEAESAYGKPVQVLMEDAKQGFIGATAALLQGALALHNRVSRADALEMIRVDAPAVTEALTAAVEAAFAKQSASGNGGAQPAKAAGKRSGRSGAKPG